MEINELEKLLEKPIRLSISVEEAETTKRLKEELEKLQKEHNKTMFSYRNCIEIIEKFRQFCKEEEIKLPKNLAFVTPWEKEG